MNRGRQFKDIPQFTRAAPHRFHMPWDALPHWLEKELNPGGRMSPLQLDPDFQRGHVWNETQQRRYVEFALRGGQSSRDLYFNHPNWQGSYRGDYVLVDGKQRLEAVRAFLSNELAIFGNHFVEDFTDRLPSSSAYFIVHINTLKTRVEVLQWYLDLNSGGVVHTEAELEWVRALLKIEENK